MDQVIIHSRLIRLSSPNLNYIIGLGAIILYLNVITLVIPTTNTDFAAVLCNISIIQIHIAIIFYVYGFTYNSTTDQSLANIIGLLSVLWYYSGKDNQDMVHIQQASCSFFHQLCTCTFKCCLMIHNSIHSLIFFLGVSGGNQGLCTCSICALSCCG